MALTGAVFDGKCFVGNNEAQDAWFSTAAPASTPGTTSYLNVFTKEAGIWRYKGYSYSATGVQTLRFNVPAPLPTFQGCDPSQSYFDGMTIGWSIVASLVLVTCFKLMQRAAS